MKLFNAIFYQYRKNKTVKESKRIQNQELNTIKKYFENGQIPWSEGYQLHKEKSITESLNTEGILQKFGDNEIISKFGYRLDERIVEYPWIFNNLKKENCKLLDAGSTFNFKYILEHALIENKDLTIFTFAPESPNFNEKRISYVYGDLRDLPFKDGYFDVVISQSTIEHIGMNNSIYGYDSDYNKKMEIKSYEFLYAIREMVRVLKPEGTLLITVPFGKFENHDFFQQFDNEMLQKLLNEFSLKGNYKTTFFKYLPDGWYCCNESDCSEMVSFNPHTNKGKADDGAAHCRSLCCIKFVKHL